MEEINNLMPCPFCGSFPVMEHIGNYRTKQRKIIIRCPSCRIERTDAAFHHDFGWLEEVSRDNWNRRAISTIALQEKLDESNGIIQQLITAVNSGNELRINVAIESAHEWMHIRDYERAGQPAPDAVRAQARQAGIEVKG